MKTLAIAFFVLATAACGCKKSDDVVIMKGYYDSMHLKRDGGGQIDFKLYLTDNADRLKVIIDKYNFRDTTIQIYVDKNSDNASLFLLLHKAMNNQAQINGNFKQPTLPTGTWCYIYLVANNKETEVSNTDLRNTLLNFEQLVETKLGK
jgi:hypothetical protein